MWVFWLGFEQLRDWWKTFPTSEKVPLRGKWSRFDCKGDPITYSQWGYHLTYRSHSFNKPLKEVFVLWFSKVHFFWKICAKSYTCINWFEKSNSTARQLAVLWKPRVASVCKLSQHCEHRAVVSSLHPLVRPKYLEKSFLLVDYQDTGCQCSIGHLFLHTETKIKIWN